MDRSGFWMLVSLIVVGLVPVAAALRSGEAIVGAPSVAFCVVAAAGIALGRELRGGRTRRGRRAGGAAPPSADVHEASASRW